jgi:ABC-2 type transport system ATP-binding protein
VSLPHRTGTAVTVTGLVKTYAGVNVVDDISFSLRASTITGFLGPNGAGKSTTLRVLLGLVTPSAGEALVFGQRYADIDQPVRCIGAVLESNDFHPSRSGRDHLRVIAALGDLPEERVDEVLGMVGLAGPVSTRRVATYSLGMRQRLGVAGAFIGDPSLLILDEPANGLDPAGMHWLRNTLRAFADRGGTVLLSSHVLAEVTQTVDHVIVINSGRIVADAALDELNDDSRTLEATYLALTTETP